MEVYGLVGPSGTGKSHRAISVAHTLDVDLIIDDGLVIQDTRILGGFSAKRQPTRIGAIRTALFFDDDHARKAKEIIKEAAPQKVLILATSARMAERIAQRLDLPPLARTIAIEEIATPKEIRKARIERTQHSKHVIPAPAVEVKKTFPDTLIDPLKVFLQRKGASEKKGWLEQSIVRPNFTSYGRLVITHGALASIAARAALEVPGVKSAGKINITKQEEGVIIELHPTVYYGHHLFKISRKIQLSVKKAVEDMTGLTVKAVHVVVKELGFAQPL